MTEGIDEADRPIALQGAGPDLFAKFDPLIEQRRALLAGGQEDPFSLVMDKVLSPTRAICNGRETILLGTYNYMGMTFDPDVIKAGKTALDQFGSGVEERVDQALRFVAHDAIRRRPRHDLVEHRKRPGGAVAHIARNPRETRFQHQDADTGSVQRLAAMSDTGNVGCHHARSLTARGKANNGSC